MATIVGPGGPASSWASSQARRSAPLSVLQARSAGVAGDQAQLTDLGGVLIRLAGEALGPSTGKYWRRASGSSWFPASTCTGIGSGESSSRTRSYSRTGSVTRSPLTRTASGVTGSESTDSTADASARAASSSPPPTVTCGSLSCARRVRPSPPCSVDRHHPELAIAEGRALGSHPAPAQAYWSFTVCGPGGSASVIQPACVGNPVPN